MSAEYNSFAAYALLLSLGVKLVNIFENSTENTCILNVSFYNVNTSYFKFCPYLVGRFTSSHTYCLISCRYHEQGNLQLSLLDCYTC
jgi:hypothetical protein